MHRSKRDNITWLSSHITTTFVPPRCSRSIPISPSTSLYRYRSVHRIMLESIQRHYLITTSLLIGKLQTWLMIQGVLGESRQYAWHACIIKYSIRPSHATVFELNSKWMCCFLFFSFCFFFCWTNVERQELVLKNLPLLCYNPRMYWIYGSTLCSLVPLCRDECRRSVLVEQCDFM